MHYSNLREADRPRLAHEILFALNIGVLASMDVPEHFYPTAFLAAMQFSMQRWINVQLHLGLSNHWGGYIAFSISVLLVAACALAFLMLLPRTLLVRWILLSAAGPIVLLALPAGWLCETHFAPVLWGLPNPPRPLLMFELTTTLICSLLYLYPKFRLPKWVAIILLFGHVVLWFWVISGGLHFWLDPFRLVFPLLVFGSAFAWGSYVRRSGAESA